MQQLINGKGNGLIKTITGIRRCGKSVLLSTIFHQHLLESGVAPENIIDISLDGRKNQPLRNPDTFLDYVDSHIGKTGMNYLLVDEVQLMDDFVEVLLSLLHVPNCDVYVTGSNSRFLSTDIVTEFRGRSQEIHMQPLSFSEFYEEYDGTPRDAWIEYREFGGLPIMASLKTRKEKMDYQAGLVRAVYLRDIVERNHLQNDDGLNDLMRVLSSSIGAPSNPTRISNTFSSVIGKTITDDTITRYIKYFKESFLIYEALRYDVKGRKYIGTETKYYFSDIGLRNSILDFRQVEPSHIMENIIYNELKHRGYNVDVGMVEVRERNSEGKQERKRLEIDFVANQGSQRYYIQSAYRMDTEAKEVQEKKSLRNVPDSFKRIIIVDDDIVPYYDMDGFVRMGLFDFLLKKNSLEF